MPGSGQVTQGMLPLLVPATPCLFCCCQAPPPRGQTSPPCSPRGPSWYCSPRSWRKTEPDWKRGSCSGVTCRHPTPVIPSALGGSGLIKSCCFCCTHRVSKWSLTPAMSLWVKRKSVTSLISKVVGSGCPCSLTFARD